MEAGSELVIVTLASHAQRSDRARVERRLAELGASIQLSFERGWIALLDRSLKSAVAVDGVVALVGGVQMGVERARRIRVPAADAGPDERSG